MKNILFFFCLLVSVSTFGQTNASAVFVRHDTTILEASDCEWIIKSLVKNDPLLTAEIGKSIPLIMLQAVQKGRLKAIDRETNQPIPGKEIFTWRMPADTVAQFDTSGNMKYVVIQAERNPADITRLRIFQDWYFDVATAALHPVVKWIELLTEVRSSSGDFIGYMPLCRIYY